MATPIDPTAPGASGSRVEELRERLRPRGIAETSGPTMSPAERFATERLQALELQLSAAHERERELTELAVRDGNTIAALEVQVTELAERAERAEAAERALFEAENRAETAVRRSELMESELRATRSEVDRLRQRVVELEASLRRALAEVGAATAERARAGRDEAEGETARLEAVAERSLELADRLRERVAELEDSLRQVVREADEATAARLRAERAVAEEEAVDASYGTDEAEGRLAELEERLTSLDRRIAGLSEPPVDEDEELAGEGELLEPELELESEDEAEPEDDEEDDTVVDLREAEQEVVQPLNPPHSRWSEWRAT